MGLELDGTGFGLGMRSQRYAAVIEDGVVGLRVLLCQPRALVAPFSFCQAIRSTITPTYCLHCPAPVLPAKHELCQLVSMRSVTNCMDVPWHAIGCALE